MEASKLSSSSSGVALAASKGEAIKIMAECAHSTVPLALLTPEVVPGMAEDASPIHVVVKSACGRAETRKVFLVHLGTAQVKVRYISPTKKVQVKADTQLVNLVCVQGEMSTEDWQKARKDPLDFLRVWLRDVAGVVPVDLFFPHTHMHQRQCIQAKARVPEAQMPNLLNVASAILG